MTYVGDFQGFWYKVDGHVYLLDEQTIFIVDFSYSGGGPAAYFWVGTDGSPGHTDESTTAFLAYPFHGRHFRYHDYPGPSIPRLENMNITLTLPSHITTSMVRWLSVWCKPFRANFGQIIFPSVAVIEDLNSSADDNIDHQELGEKQDDNNRTKSQSDKPVEEATEIVLNENVFEAPSITEAMSEKMKEMKAREGKSFSDESYEERMDVNKHDTKVEFGDNDVTDDDAKVEAHDKDVVDKGIKLEPSTDDLEANEKRTGQYREKTDSSCVTILPSMFLFIFVVLII